MDSNPIDKAQRALIREETASPKDCAWRIKEMGGRVADLVEGTRIAERTLAQEHYDESEDARARLAEARKWLRWAAGSLEEAATQL